MHNKSFAPQTICFMGQNQTAHKMIITESFRSRNKIEHLQLGTQEIL